MEQVNDLISQLYTQMNLSEWHASREKVLAESIENIKHELEPYEKVGLFKSLKKGETALLVVILV